MNATQRLRTGLLAAVRTRIVGHEGVLERLHVALLAGGHVLLEGVPGLAKTLMARSVAQALDVSFRRIQFTPDLLPSDVLGGLVYRRATEQFVVSRGPLFAHVVLADEINRAPPKVQSALLEAMEERQATLGGHTLPLPDPFLVLATQNPLEQQGTYPLAEAQLDRFLFHIRLDYPSEADEAELVDRHLDAGAPSSTPTPDAAGGTEAGALPDAETLRALREAVGRVHVDPAVRRYLLALIRASRQPEGAGVGALAGMVEAGASPRAALHLARAAQALAALRGRDHVLPADVQELFPDLVRHRLLLSIDAEVEGLTPDAVSRRLLDHVPVP